MTLEELFQQIAKYHDKLGYPKRVHSVEEGCKEANKIIQALYAELSELQGTYPWKPWRPIDYQKIDFDNMSFEIIDILFFLGSFMEIFVIKPEELQKAFNIKLEENYKRIERGYNKKNVKQLRCDV